MALTMPCGGAVFADIRTFMDLHLQSLALSDGTSCTVIDGADNHTGLHTYQYYDTCPYDFSE
jgi:hypothetical protein